MPSFVVWKRVRCSAFRETVQGRKRSERAQDWDKLSSDDIDAWEPTGPSTPLLDTVSFPVHMKHFSTQQLRQLCLEIRKASGCRPALWARPAILARPCTRLRPRRAVLGRARLVDVCPVDVLAGCQGTDPR